MVYCDLETAVQAAKDYVKIYKKQLMSDSIQKTKETLYFIYDLKTLLKISDESRFEAKYMKNNICIPCCESGKCQGFLSQQIAWTPYLFFEHESKEKCLCCGKKVSTALMFEKHPVYSGFYIKKNKK